MAVELIPRAEALGALPVLAHTVRGMQDAEDPSRDYNRETWAGREAEGAAWFAARRDPPPERVVEVPKHDGVMIFAAPSPDRDEALDELAAGLVRLMETQGDSTLTFLHTARDRSWPSPRTTPAVLADAAAWFRAAGAGEEFDGALRTGADGLRELLRALAWSVRMDMGYGDVFFAPDRSPWVGSLCQYANLHLDVYGRGEAVRVASAASRAGLVAVEECGEREEGGAIPFRELRV
ncbi:MAG TPA: hypothetical protein VFQ39_01165 [Longimicrobium sp.]|nr:hypothetical protein [Longimicrobium sp.]